MDLSKVDRLKLYYQFEILKILNRDDPDQFKMYENYQIILQDGYQGHYKDLLHLSDDLPRDISSFVWNVLQLYAVLYRSYFLLNAEEKKEIKVDDIKYHGFDGNEEPEYYAYSCFLLEDMKAYPEIYDEGKAELNSHYPIIDTYEDMLTNWEQIRDNDYGTLTKEQIKQIIANK